VALPYQDTFTTGTNQAISAYNVGYVTVTGAMQVRDAEDAVFPNASGADSFVVWDTDAPGVSQYVQAKMTPDDTDGAWIGIAARCSTIAFTGYLLYLHTLTGGNATFVLAKEVAGAFNQLDTGSVAWVAGDTLRLEATGTTTTSLVMKRNGTPFGSTYNDSSSAITSGKGGLVTFSNALDVFMDDLEIGDLAGGGSSIAAIASSLARMRQNN
jgi:hypothetical protein